MQNLREIRTAIGYSQIKLANKSGVSRFRIYLAESGSLVLRPNEVHAIREALRPEIEKAARIACEFSDVECASV